MKQPPSADRFYAGFQKVQQLLRQQLQAHLQQQSGDMPLTRGQFYLLRHLHASGPLTMTDLAGWSNVTPATMSTLADRLEKHGWIERRKSDGDRRVVKLALTETGGAFIRAIEASWRETLAGRLQHLSADEQWLLTELLEKLAAGAEPDGTDKNEPDE
jgi:DNA-binding MarR family transcriptional regulator